jgi:starch-binding outer membrane protein, SusD/RagB family
MKNIKLIIIVSFLGILAGCSDGFLEREPKSNYVEDTYYASDDALNSICTPLYNRVWFNFNRRAMFGMGSLRANDAYNPYAFPEFVRFQTTSLTSEVAQAWSSLYTVVTMSNSIINGVTNKCTGDVSQEAKDMALGECYLMRGVAYFYMVRIWGPSILFENNDDVVEVPIRPLNPEEDVFKFIIRDLKNACDLLPEQNSEGRATCWAAKALLAKVYLAHSGWDKGGTRNEEELAECIRLCEDVIDNSGASLIEYENLFKYRYNNSNESLLAMQWAPLGSWGTSNCLISDLSFSDVCDVSCWGNNLAASIDMIELYNQDPDDTLRRKATFFNYGSYYSYIHSATGGYTYNKEWMQNKKGVVGCKEDNDNLIAIMNSPLNTYIIRLADVFLIHAEASLGNNESLSGGRGLESFNLVRDRAGINRKSTITFEDIIRERRVEFCMEYQNWFDMVSWYRWKPDYMLDYFNNKQHRGYEIANEGIKLLRDGTISWHVKNFQIDGEDVWDSLEGYAEANPDHQYVTISADNIFLPYPEADKLQNHYLTEEPQPYNFNE